METINLSGFTTIFMVYFLENTCQFLKCVCWPPTTEAELLHACRQTITKHSPSPNFSLLCEDDGY